MQLGKGHPQVGDCKGGHVRAQKEGDWLRGTHPLEHRERDESGLRTQKERHSQTEKGLNAGSNGVGDDGT